MRSFRQHIRSVSFCCSAFALLGLALVCEAQQPAKNYTGKKVFHLPIRLEDRHRMALKEIRLFVRTPSTPWEMKQQIPPSGSFFTYRVPHDGEFWFSVAMVDLSDNQIPADINSVPAGKVVIVDTQMPTITVSTHVSSTGEPLLQCHLADDNADASSLQVLFHNSAGQQQTLPSLPGQPGVYTLRGLESLKTPLEVLGKDLAGNAGKVMVDVRELLTTSVAGTAPMLPTLPAIGPEVAPPTFPPVASAVPGSLPTPPGTAAAIPTTVAQDTTSVVPVTGSSEPMLPPPGVEVPPVSVPPVTSVPLPQATTDTAPVQTAQSQIPQTSIPQIPPQSELPAATLPQLPTPGQGVVGQTQTVLKPNLPSPGGNNIPNRPANTGMEALGNKNANSGSMPGNRQLLNTPEATIEYRIDQVGPSGVGKVEVFLTPDQGQNWQRIKEDHDKRNPVTINLPGEGLFGIRLAITNGNGFGGTPPRPNDTPDFWIELDTTSPFVQLQTIDPNVSGGQLNLRWIAKDKNLGSEPVSLFFRTRNDAAWQPITRNLKNTGSFQWSFPRDAGPQFFVKIEVVDQAGNIARAETPNPILLDLTEPRGFVLGVTSSTPRNSPPQGN